MAGSEPKPDEVLLKVDNPVSRLSPNTLGTRVVPIIVLPGIMGTRLSFDGGETEWDPDSPVTRMAKWTLMTAQQKARLLNFETPASIIDEDVGRGWTTVAKSFYRDFLTAMDGKKFLKNVATPVYAVGFDWRQSNADSGTYLATKVSRILEIEKANQAIVITHSMGGLVARSAIKQTRGLSDKILGVIHIAQPVAGAVVLYRRIFTGALPGWDGDENLTQILGKTTYEFMIPLSGIPGVFELLPTQQYRYVPDDFPSEAEIKNLHGPWESKEKGTRDSMGRTVYPQGVSARYLSDDSPPGLFNTAMHGSPNKKDTKKTKSLVQKNIKGAAAFHEKLGLFLHKNTWTLYSTGLDTDVAVKYPVTHSNDLAYRLKLGDGTVPDASAAALFVDSFEATIDNVRVAKNRQFFVKHAEHGAILDNATIRKMVEQMVYQMIKNS